MIISGLPADIHAWKVTSYGRIFWNSQAPDSPFLEVSLQALDPPKNIIVKKIPLWDAMNLTIGSIIQSGVVLHSLSSESTKLYTTIDFDSFKYVPAYKKMDADTNTSTYLIPPYKWSIPFESRNTPFLDVTDQIGTRLLIPTLVIFLKTYGVSAYFKSTFINHSKEETLKALTFNIDYEKMTEQPSSDEVPIGLSRDTHDNDAYIIYELGRSHFLSWVQRNIRAQLNSGRKSGCFLRVPFWFKGNIQLKLTGKYVHSSHESKRFLVHDIQGMSYPNFPNFFIDRENTNLVANRNDRLTSREGWSPRGSNSYENADRSINLDSSQPISADGSSISGIANQLTILGYAPNVRKSIRKDRQSSCSPSREPLEHQSYSASKTKASQGDGAANLATEQIFKPPLNTTSAIVLNTWQGLKLLEQNEKVNCVEAIEIQGQNTYLSRNLTLIQFPISTSWSTNRGDGRIPRLLLVAKVTLRNSNAYVLEIEEKISRVGKVYQRHPGAIFFGELSYWDLSNIIKILPEVNGIWRELPDYLFSRMVTFKHMNDIHKKPEEIMHDTIARKLGLEARGNDS